MEDRANAGVKRELQDTLKQLKALPKTQLLPAANGNGNGNGAEQKQEGPAALLARCREIAMQVQVRGAQGGRQGFGSSSAFKAPGRWFVHSS